MSRSLSCAVLTAAALSLASCATAPGRPAAPYSYRALGTEPGWSLTIDQKSITYVGDYGEVRIVEPTPRAIIAFAGETYQTPRLGVNIVHTRCSDGMSDRIYRDKVEVVADGKRVTGCGGEIVIPTALAGSSWRVAAINNRPTPGGASYFMNFTADKVSARFGCNSFGSAYREAGDTVTVDDGILTVARCAEPIMTFEREAMTLLAKPLRASWSGGDRLTLVNSAGRIELERSH